MASGAQTSVLRLQKGAYLKLPLGIETEQMAAEKRRAAKKRRKERRRRRAQQRGEAPAARCN